MVRLAHAGRSLTPQRFHRNAIAKPLLTLICASSLKQRFELRVAMSDRSAR